MQGQTSTVTRECPGCGQRLRVPAKLGGMTMACPTCGQKLYTPFRIGRTGKAPETGPSLYTRAMLSRLNVFG